MHDLEISWRDGRARFGPDDAPVVVGRSSTSSVIVTDGIVSRRHLIFTWARGSWRAEDVSTHGTYDPIGVRLSTHWTVGTDTVFRLGRHDGPELSVRLITRALAERLTEAGIYDDPESPPTIIDFGPPPPPSPDRAPDPPPDRAPVPPPGRAPAPPPDRVAPGPPPIDLRSAPYPADGHGYEPGRERLDAPTAFDPGPVAPVPTDGEPATRARTAGSGLAELAARAQARTEPDPVQDPARPEPVIDLRHRDDRPAEMDHDLDRYADGADPNGQPVRDQPASEFPERNHATPRSDHATLRDDHATFRYDPAAPHDGGAGPRYADRPEVEPHYDRRDEAAFPYPDQDNPAPGMGPGGPALVDPDWNDGGYAVAAPPPPGPQPEATAPAATMVESDTLRLSIDGDDYVLLPGQDITVGRDPRCAIHVDERHTLVSRRHLRFSHHNGGWWLEDTSSKGSYVDGRPVTGPYRVEGAFMVEMGDPRAGTSLRVLAAGTHKRPRNVAGIVIAAVAAAALILVSLLAWFIFRGDATEAGRLEQAKRATVMLLGDTGQGSGFFVTESLIVTNQHVAALADQLVVAVSREADEPAQIQYVARTVENHPFLDLAVVRVTNRAQLNDQGSVDVGEPVEGSDQPALVIGDSSTVTLGDAIYSTGFPGRLSISSADDEGNLRLSPVATTRGDAESLTIWPGCSNPDFANFIPADAPTTVTCSADGDIDDAVLIASFTSGQGASGSPVIADGEVVAVVFAGSDTENDVSRSITTDAFSAWLSSVVAANQ